MLLVTLRNRRRPAGGPRGWFADRLRLLLAIGRALPVCSVVFASHVSSQELKFNRDIRPILAENCFVCHGPDKGRRQADLRLDLGSSATEAGVIAAGDPDASELIARVESDDPDSVMPPPDSHKSLTVAEKAILRRWVAEGGEYQGHWAYERPSRPDIPIGETAIDYLIRQRLEREGLALSLEADRRTLARRLGFDLVGLPPTAEEVRAFEEDTSPDAYARLVERLLESPHYGERMAQTWLDVVRFADTIGYHSDNPRNVWPYRDYVIRAFNDNKPFDEFTIEQLAGDLLPESDLEDKVASCFNRLLLTTEEGGAQPKDYEARMLGDRVRAVGTVWLGQTVGCCQCHDHKYDPATMRDFYSLGAFFADIQEPTIGAREPGMIVPQTAEQESELNRLRDRLQKLRDDFESAAPALEGAEYLLARYEGSLPRVLISVSMPAPRTVRILPRGNWMDESGPIVEPALPQFLTSDESDQGRRLNRLDLANWIVSRDNPLTARVFVNRLWKQFFGVGLSKNLDDLGSQGEWPVHAELLDWLACEFMESGWDVKHMVRLIVTSAAYRQASSASPELLAKDPDNRLVARQSRFRLDAEIVRDNALAIAGLLDKTIGGPSAKPYQPAGYWENLNFPPRDYQPDQGSAQYRRGLYTWWQRSFLHPSLLAFDAPTREECAADRPRSNIPQQALVLLNDPTYVEAARVFATNMIRNGGPDAQTRIDYAWWAALSRSPRDDERRIAADLVERHGAEFSADREAAEQLINVGFAPVPDDIDPVELATWTSVARLVLNLHETVTRN